MKPFVREAKQDFRAEAVPIVVEMKCMFRVCRRWEGRVDSWGPDRGMEGRVHGGAGVDDWDCDCDCDCEESVRAFAIAAGVPSRMEGLALSACLSLSLSLSFLRDGGGPMIPPSRNLMVMGGAGAGSSLCAS